MKKSILSGILALILMFGVIAAAKGTKNKKLNLGPEGSVTRVIEQCRIIDVYEWLQGTGMVCKDLKTGKDIVFPESEVDLSTLRVNSVYRITFWDWPEVIGTDEGRPYLKIAEFLY